MHIVDMIYFWARTVPNRLAIIQSEMVTTFQGLADAIESIGERIDRLNLNKSEPVAVCLANPSFLIATSFALMRNGYSVAPVNVRLYPHLAAAGIRNLIYDMDGQVTSGGRNIRFDMSWLPSPGEPTAAREYRKRPNENPDLIFFTSGTTGFPKKIIQSAASLDQVLSNPVTRMAAAFQKALIMPGLSSGYGFRRTCELLNSGKTVCFAPDVMAALSLINLFGVEVVLASTAQALSLSQLKNENPGFRTDSLRTIFVAGGKIDAEGIARIQTALCRNVIDYYSSSEVGLVALSVADSRAGIPGATVLPWAELEIVDEANRLLPTGADGFVRVRTPYLVENIKSAGRNEIAGVQNGWFYPGDVGSLDEDGMLHLVGRDSDVLNRGGVKVSGIRVEEILKQMLEVADAGVCGVAGPSGLEEIWIALIVKGDVDIEAIKQHLREHSDVGIAPDEIFIVDQIPRTELGKIQKYRLKELLLGLKNGA